MKPNICSLTAVIVSFLQALLTLASGAFSLGLIYVQQSARSVSLTALVNSLRAEHQKYLQGLGAHMEMQWKVITMEKWYLEDNPPLWPRYLWFCYLSASCQRDSVPSILFSWSLGALLNLSHLPSWVFHPPVFPSLTRICPWWFQQGVIGCVMAASFLDLHFVTKIIILLLCSCTQGLLDMNQF